MWLGLYTQQSSGHTRGFGCPLPFSEATRKTETCDRRAARAATPHYRRPSGLYTAEMHLSQFWMPESPRSRRGQIQGLVRATFRVHTRHLLSCPHVAGEARGLFIRARIPFIRAHDPIAPLPEAPPTDTITLGSRFQLRSLGAGTPTCSPGRDTVPPSWGGRIGRTGVQRAERSHALRRPSAPAMTATSDSLLHRTMREGDSVSVCLRGRRRWVPSWAESSHRLGERGAVGRKYHPPPCWPPVEPGPLPSQLPWPDSSGSISGCLLCT